MKTRIQAPAQSPQIHDCWNRMGVRGDQSCPELAVHVHCRNCPVHAEAALALLDRALPSDHAARWTELVARETTLRNPHSRSLVLFEIGNERLALPTMIFDEIADLRPIHSLPHRRDDLVLGVCNIRGELQICLSLHRLLGIEAVAISTRQRLRRGAIARLLVLQYGDHKAVVPCDGVLGIERIPEDALMPVPATVSRAVASHSRALFVCQERSCGLLDEARLFQSISRSLQSSSAI